MEITNRYRATGLDDVIRQQGRMRDWVAVRAGVHGSLITHLLAGRRTVGENVAMKIATALDVPLFLLFELTSGSEMQPDQEVTAA